MERSGKMNKLRCLTTGKRNEEETPNGTNLHENNFPPKLNYILGNSEAFAFFVANKCKITKSSARRKEIRRNTERFG